MRLEAYLTANDIDAPTFAELIKVRPQSVYRYIARDRVPRPQVMERIIRATSGAVQPNDFFDHSSVAPSPLEAA